MKTLKTRIKAQTGGNDIYADRINDVPRSFIREILKVTESDDIISFAGGLPNRELFPVEELKRASANVFDTAGKEALQYSTTEGYLPLREFIAEQYLLKQGLGISPENILITSGSQQGLDLLGKTFINKGDAVIIEEPGYLGAIQAFSLYRPLFRPIPLNNDGMDIQKLEDTLRTVDAKLLYTVPDFQNPSGISYSNEVRLKITQLLKGRKTFLIEDSPYVELRYSGEPTLSFFKFIPEQTILLGTYSKTVVPSFRLGWLVAPKEIMNKIIIAKQASDLHTNYFIQQLLFDYLTNSDSEGHIKRICEVYGRQRDVMIGSIRKYFPAEVSYTMPDGGMFLWVTLPLGMSSMQLFEIAMKEKVAFVPGNPFYTDAKPSYNTLRLNFSCSDGPTIEEGIRRLGRAIYYFMDQK